MDYRSKRAATNHENGGGEKDFVKKTIRFALFCNFRNGEKILFFFTLMVVHRTKSVDRDAR